MIAIELVAAIDVAGTTQKFYISDEPLNTLSTDIPANVSFDPTLNSFNLSMLTFANGRTTGNSSNVKSSISINNTNGMYDHWLDYSFDGRAIIVRKGVGAYPSQFEILFSGIVESVNVTATNLNIILKDNQARLDKQLSQNNYAGNNALPNGLEGTSDLKGKPKPKLFGSVYNIAPILVNSSKLTYQVNDGAVNSIVVRDKGVNLTLHTNYATSAQLQSASVPSGNYATCLAEGYFRLGSTPAGKVTANVEQGASTTERTVAAIVKAIAQTVGVSLADIKTAEFDAVQAANNSIVGIYETGSKTALQAIDELSQSIGAYTAFSPAGKLGIGILTLPGAIADFEFVDYDIQSGIQRQFIKDNENAIHTVKVNYNKNYSPFANDLAGSVGAAESAKLSSEYLVELASDLTVKNQYLNADEIEVKTLLTTQTAAGNEATRLLNIYKQRRNIFEVPIHFDSLPTLALYLMANVKIQFGRFGLQNGKVFRLLGVNYDYAIKRATLIVWG